MGTQQLLSQAGAPTLLACDSGRDSAWVQRMDEDLLLGADALERRFAEENVASLLILYASNFEYHLGSFIVISKSTLKL